MNLPPVMTFLLRVRLAGDVVEEALLFVVEDRRPSVSTWIFALGNGAPGLNERRCANSILQFDVLIEAMTYRSCVASRLAVRHAKGDAGSARRASSELLDSGTPTRRWRDKTETMAGSRTGPRDRLKHIVSE